MVEKEKIDVKKEYEKVQAEFGWPNFEKFQEDFDVEKTSEKDDGIFVREIRRTVGDKITGYLHLFETLINPTSTPMFILSFLKGATEIQRKEIRSCHKELSRIQLKMLELDTIFDKKTEGKFIKETYDKWQPLKKRIYALIIEFEKEFEKDTESKEKSYFG